MSISIISIITIILWIAISKELEKSSKGENKQKLIIFMASGSLSTLILTISLFQKLQF
ncbi:MAG TPA: hypothetical protein VNS08_00585 [Ureibacillus sp.]|nr:hypothetical protein [Ureibacillus sp.]